MEVSLQGADQELRKLVVLRDIDEDDFHMLIKAAQQLRCRLGQTLVSAGTSPESLFILLSGKVRLALSTGTGETSAGYETLYTMSVAGDFFGAELVVGQWQSPFDVRSAGETTLLEIPASAVRAVCAKNQKFEERLRLSCRLTSWYLMLRRVPQFQQLTYWQARSFLMRCRHEHLDSESTVAVLGMVIVLSGSVKLIDPQAEQTFAAGEMFGTELLHSDAVSRVRLVADQPTELLVLERAAYEDLRKYNYELICQLDSLLGQHVAPALQAPAQTPPVVEVTAPAREPLAEEPAITKARRVFKRYPVIRQQSIMDCGPTCLAMISNFYGQRVNLNLMRELTSAGRYGTSLLTLAETAEKLGFIVRGLRANYEGLCQLRLPALCHWGKNHFVVVFEANKEYAIVGDPAEGQKKLTEEEFSSHFSGALLELSPATEFGKFASYRSPWMMLLPIVSLHRQSVRDIMFGTLVLQVLALLTPMFTQVILDRVIIHESLSMLNMMLLGMFIVSIFQVAIGYFRGFVLAFVSMRIDQKLLTQFYRHLLDLPLRFFEDRTIGEIVSRFAENEKIRALLSGPLLTLSLDVLTAIIYLSVIFFYNLGYGFAVIIYMICFAAVMVVYTPVLKNLSRTVFDKQVASNAFLVESIRGIERVKTSAVEVRARWRWEELYAATQGAKFKELQARNVGLIVSRLINTVGQVVFLWLGATLVIEKKISVGQLMALNMMTSMTVQPVIRLIEMWDQLQDVTISLERLGDVFEAAPEEPDPAKKFPIKELRGEIKFSGVTFRYSNMAESNALANVDFVIAPGQVLAVVGRSGCGKSTLLKLALGLYRPTAGKVMVDGSDLAQVSLVDYRRLVGVVCQNEYFFQGTVRENLTQYAPDATIDEIRDAAKIADIDEFVQSLPYGYESIVSEGGINFSGGQRQRLAIARAIVHKPKLLIFDEATSALDGETERNIQRSMEKLRQNHTLLVVAHRLSTVRDADSIIVLERGEVVERGTHSSLMDEKGLYYHLARQQQLS